jgi:hypothetical protein
MTFPCPWCDREVALTADAVAQAQVRCDACATVVDLAPEPVSAHPVIEGLPLAA